MHCSEKKSLEISSAVLFVLLTRVVGTSQFRDLSVEYGTAAVVGVRVGAFMGTNTPAGHAVTDDAWRDGQNVFKKTGNTRQHNTSGGQQQQVTGASCRSTAVLDSATAADLGQPCCERFTLVEGQPCCCCST